MTWIICWKVATSFLCFPQSGVFAFSVTCPLFIPSTMTACVGLVSCKYSPYSSIMGETHCFLGNDYQVSSFSGFRGKMQKVAVSWIHVLQCFWRIVSLGPP